MGSNLAVQLVECMAKLLQDFVAAGCESIHASAFRSLGLRRAQPAASRHPCQDGIQRPRAQPIAVVVQFLEHPLAVDASSVSRMMQDVNLPERQQEFPRNRIAHQGGMIAPRLRNRKTIKTRARGLVAGGMSHSEALSRLTNGDERYL